MQKSMSEKILDNFHRLFSPKNSRVTAKRKTFQESLNREILR